MKTNMKKSDLKTGMIVELRDGQKGMILESVGEFGTLIQGRNGWASLSRYNNDLTVRYPSNSLDIIRVYRPNRISQIVQARWEAQELIWEREEPRSTPIKERR